MINNLISSTVTDTNGNVLLSIPKDHYEKVDVFEDHIVFSSFFARFTKFNTLKYSEETNVYSFRKNRNGDYYLVGEKLDNDAKELTFSHDPLMAVIQKTNNPYLEDQLIAMYNRVSKTDFSKIATLNDNSNGIIYPNKAFLYFPLLRHELPLMSETRQNPCGIDYPRTMNSEDALETLLTATRNADSMLMALRESNSLREFCDLMYPQSSLQSDEDYVWGSQISLSWHLVSVNTGLTLSEQVRLESNFYNLVSHGLLNMFSFLLDRGTINDRNYLLNAFLQTSYREYKKKRSQLPPVEVQLTDGSKAILPFDVRKIKSLQLTDEESQEFSELLMRLMRNNNVVSYSAYSGLNTPAAEWFGKRNMKLLSNSKHSKEDILNLWVEIFGDTKNAPIPDALFDKMPPSLRAVSVDFFALKGGWLFWENLKNLCDFYLDSSYALKTIVGYDYEECAIIPLYDLPVSYDVFVSKLHAVREMIDSSLTHLDLELTPQNRTAYLSMYKDDRSFSQSWSFLTWGVRDIVKISALNTLLGYSVEELKNFSELPDDLFYELLFDCGKPISPVLIIDEVWQMTSTPKARTPLGSGRVEISIG